MNARHKNAKHKIQEHKASSIRLRMQEIRIHNIIYRTEGGNITMQDTRT